MGRVNPPYTLTAGTPAKADEVMAIINAVIAEMNGGLVADLNVQTDAAVTLDGNSNEEGGSAALARANHRHVIQGIERLAADPTTSLWDGRLYWNTTSKQLREYRDGDWHPGTNLVSSDLPAHASLHGAGGSDALADNAVSSTMIGRSYGRATLVPDNTKITPANAWMDMTTADFTVTTSSSAQLVTFYLQLFFNNTHTDNIRYWLELIDVSDATPVVIWTNGGQGMAAGSPAVSNYSHTLHPTIPWNAPARAGGAHTVRLRAACDVNNVLNFNKNTTPPPTGAGSREASYLRWVVG